jgi:hypothetical protein
MEKEAVALALGDPCPNCQGELRPAPVPTDAQRARAADRENPIVLDRRFDSATPAQRDDLGALYRCAECGYVARFKDTASAAAKGKKGKGE